MRKPRANKKKKKRVGREQITVMGTKRESDRIKVRQRGKKAGKFNTFKNNRSFKIHKVGRNGQNIQDGFEDKKDKRV